VKIYIKEFSAIQIYKKVYIRKDYNRAGNWAEHGPGPTESVLVKAGLGPSIYNL